MSTLKVSKTWCLSAFPLLWARPGITSISQLASLVRVLLTPVPRLTLPYPNYVRRISLVALGQYLTDEYFLGLAQCHRVERLTLSGASQVSSFALRAVIEKMPDLVAVDLASTPGTDYTVLEAIGANCPRLHGLNLSGCKDVDANGVMALTRGCKVLRRVSNPPLRTRIKRASSDLSRSSSWGVIGKPTRQSSASSSLAPSFSSSTWAKCRNSLTRHYKRFA